MGMIERVAKALHEKMCEQDVNGYLDAKLDAGALARAAIEAMRDVDDGSPAILKAGKQSLYSCSSDPELEDARECWQAMIDAALEETA